MVFPQITNQINSKRQLVNFIDRLERVKTDLYRTDFNWQKKNAALFTMEEKIALDTAVEKNRINVKKNPQLTAFLNELITKLNALPEIELTTAIFLTVSQLELIHSRLEMMINSCDFVIKTMVNPEIIGGAIIGYKGKYGDYSLETHNQRRP